MFTDDNFDYLVKTTYQPRVAASGLAMVVTLSRYMDEALLSNWLLAFIALLLLYPHLLYWIIGLTINSANAAKASMLVDALVVGLLVWANGFNLFASVSFIAALAFSTLIIARPFILVLNLFVLLIVLLWGLSLNLPIRLEASIISDTLCSGFLILYCVLVAYKVSRVTTGLRQSQHLVEQDNKALSSVTNYLRPYVSPQLYTEISHKSAAQHEIKRKCLTVLFSDIEGFTALMELLEEDTMTGILNDYLNVMAETAIQHGGTIDKFMGDGIMIFFGAPVSRGAQADALACVHMALAMRENLTKLRQQWRQAGVFSRLHMRIGINTGHCAVGNFGSENRMDYTAIGSVINLASRLEASAGRDAILISDATYGLIEKTIKCDEQAPIRVKGIQRAVDNYVVLGEQTKVNLFLNEQDIAQAKKGI